MKKFKIPFISKKAFKRRNGKCIICGETEYNLLDTHRYKIEGKNGGRYTNNNCICVCSNCHRLIHSKKIKIIGVFDSSAGKMLNYFDQNGDEHFHRL